MASVDKESANWRLFGGGGLILAGVVGAIGAVAAAVAPVPAIAILYAAFFLLIGVALLFVAFGQTGSNGAVGNSLFGKVSQLVFAAGWILGGILQLLAFAVALPSALIVVVSALIVIGGILSAVAIYAKGVARGIAKWALFVPAVFSILYVLTFIGVVPGQFWIDVVEALLFLLTGVVYLLNRK